MMNSLNEGSAPIGFLNSILSLNPFGKTKKIINLMKEVNSLRVNIAREKGSYYKKLKELMDKYLVGTKIAKDEQEALKLEYQDSLKKAMSEYGKDLSIQDKDVKTLVDNLFKAEENSNLIPQDKTLEKIPDVSQFKEAYLEKLKAMDAKADALLAQAKDLTYSKDEEKKRRLETLFATMKNWISINAANEALKYASEKERDAIKSSIKIKDNLGAVLANHYKDLDIKSDTKDEKGDSEKKKEKREYLTDFDYNIYKSDINLSESEKDEVKRLKAEFDKKKSEDIEEAQDLKNQYETLVRNVIDGGSRGFIVFGKGGLGKSFTVEQYLKKKEMENEKDYILIKGSSSPVKIFEKMKNNPNKLFIFDDADSLWNSQEGRNLLKGALDSKEKGGYVSWEKSGAKIDPKSPNSFYFTGKIIFISNLSGDVMKKDQDIAAIFTRIENLDFSFSNSQTFAMTSELLNANKMNWKDFGIPKEAVTEGDIKYLSDVYDQVYFLNIHDIESVAPVRAVGVTMQKLKDAQVDIVTNNIDISPRDLHESITSSIENKTRFLTKK